MSLVSLAASCYAGIETGNGVFLRQVALRCDILVYQHGMKLVGSIRLALTMQQFTPLVRVHDFSLTSTVRHPS